MSNEKYFEVRLVESLELEDEDGVVLQQRFVKAVVYTDTEEEASKGIFPMGVIEYDNIDDENNRIRDIDVPKAVQMLLPLCKDGKSIEIVDFEG